MRSFSFILAIMLCAVTSASAQEAVAPAVPQPVKVAVEDKNQTAQVEETLPIEVALMYYKLLKEEPNFDFLVFASPAFRKDPDKMSDENAVKAQRSALEKIYKSFTPQTVFYAVMPVKMDMQLMDTSTVELSGIEPDAPVIYDMTSSEKYGVFIRNARDTFKMSQPFEVIATDAILGLTPEQRKTMDAEMTLRPLASDREEFLTDDDERLRVIVADIVELKIYNEDHTKLLLQKRFKNWRPPAPPPKDALFQPGELIPPTQVQ